MTKKPREKKSESLDVRLPYSVKRKFMTAAKSRGETASAAVRRFIDGYIEEAEAGPSHPPLKEVAMTARRNPLKTLAIAGATAGAFSLAALPSAADDTFSMLDKNGDGQLVVGEIAPGQDEVIIEILDTDKSGAVSKAEFDNPPEGVKIAAHKNAGNSGDEPKVRKVIVKSISAESSKSGQTLSEAEMNAEIRKAIREAMPNATEAEIDAFVAGAEIKTQSE